MILIGSLILRIFTIRPFPALIIIQLIIHFFPPLVISLL